MKKQDGLSDRLPDIIGDLIRDFTEFMSTVGYIETRIDVDGKVIVLEALLSRAEELCWSVACDGKVDAFHVIVEHLIAIEKICVDTFRGQLKETIKHISIGSGVLQKRYEVHPVMNLNGVVRILLELSSNGECRAQVLQLAISGIDLTRTEYLLGELRNAGLVEEKKDVAGQPRFAITEAGRNQLEIIATK